MRVLLACMIVLFAPAVASAGVVSSGQQAVMFQAAPGEANQVTVGDDLLVSDAGAPLAAGPGCVQVDAHAARCGMPLNCSGFTYDAFCWFDAVLGDGDDVLDADPPLLLLADGGPGADRLLGGGGYDQLTGGPGADFMQGRGGGDTVVYDESDRSGGVVVRIDDAPGDGASGEGDDARAEFIRGTPDADTLVGNDVDNIIDGSGGADQIACRGGFDIVYMARPQAARRSCERVLVDFYSARLTPTVSGTLDVRNGAVDVQVAPDAAGPWQVSGEVELSTGGGRRLGGVAVQSADRLEVRIPLTSSARRLVRRRGELTVRVTGSVPDRSVSRALALLRA